MQLAYWVREKRFWDRLKNREKIEGRTTFLGRKRLISYLAACRRKRPRPFVHNEESQGVGQAGMLYAKRLDIERGQVEKMQELHMSDHSH